MVINDFPSGMLAEHKDITLADPGLESRATTPEFCSKVNRKLPLPSAESDLEDIERI